MENILIVDHPLVQHKLSILRDENTKPQLFRILVKEITTIIGYEATKDLLLVDRQVKTPLAIADTKRLSSIPFIVPIIRAGISMLDPMLELLPTASVGFIGLVREEGKGDGVVKVKQYYIKLPVDANLRDAIIVDPMLATATTACIAITELKKAGVQKIKLMCIVASNDGIKRVTSEHPDVQLFCAAIDEHLLPNNYISPGLGDAGDRLYSIE